MEALPVPLVPGRPRLPRHPAGLGLILEPPEVDALPFYCHLRLPLVTTFRDALEARGRRGPLTARFMAATIR